MKNFNREAIQRMFDGRKGGGGGGTNNADLAGYATQMWVNQNYVSIEFFNRLFSVHGHDPEDESSTPTDISVLPNDMDSIVDSIESMVGFYTEEYLSALGLNPDTGTGNATTLYELLDVKPNSDVSPSRVYGLEGTSADNGKVLTYSTTYGKWIASANGAGSGSVTSIDMTVPTGFSVSGAPITTYGTLAVTFGGSIAKNKVLASPANATGSPDWRTLVASDIPDLSATYASASDVTTLQGYFDNLGNANSANKLAVYSKTAWGQTYWTSGGVPDNISGDMTSVGDITASSYGTKDIKGFRCLEMYGAASSNFGGYIDFHYNNDSGDYTSRIIEDASGVLKINNTIWATLSGDVGVGTSTTYTKLTVNGGVKTTKLYLYKPNTANDTNAVYFEYDSANAGVHLVGAGFYGNSYISALGLNSQGGGGGITLNEPLNGINNAGLSAPTSSASGQTVVWNGSAWTYSINTTLRAGSVATTGGASIYGNVESTSGNFIASAGHGYTVSGKDNTYVLLAGGGTKLLSEIGGGSYVTSVGVTDDTTNHNWQLRYVKNNVSTYFTPPYAERTKYIHSCTIPDTYGYHICAIIGQPTIGNADGNAYAGSSANFKLWSYPNGATAINSNNTANIECIRLFWGSSFFKDIFMSPNNNYIFFRSIIDGNARDWAIIPTFTYTQNAIGVGSASQPVYVDSTGKIVAANTYNLDNIQDGTTRKLADYLPLSGGTMANTNLVTNLNAEYLQGYSVCSYNKPYNKIALVNVDGVMEVGKYLDFHPTSDAASTDADFDHAVRIQCTTRNKVTVNLPSSTGTLALTSDIPTDNASLTNGAGYITSSGSCAYATNAGTLGGYAVGSMVLDAGGNLSSSNKIYDIGVKRVFSGNNMPDAPVTGWVSGIVLGSNWNNNHFQHYLVEAQNGHWYTTRHYTNGSMDEWKTFAYLTDNVASATKLETSRNINGTLFDGSADITTTKWGTSRNFTIKDADSTNAGSAVSVDGSAAATLLLPSTIKASLTGNADTATKLASSVTIWGQSFDGSANVSGNLSSVADISGTGAIYGFQCIELNINGKLANFGGFIDFHFNKSSADYTSRIIEDASGRLNINSIYFTSYAISNLNVINSLMYFDRTNNRVGIDSTTPSEKLDVNGNIKTSANNGAYIQIGDIRIVYDNAATNGNNALKVVKSDGTAANFYATGAVSALGANTSSGGAGDYIPLSGSTAITGSLVPATINTYDLGSSTKAWGTIYCNAISGNASLSVQNVSCTTFSTSARAVISSGAKFYSIYIESDSSGNVSSSHSGEINRDSADVHLQYASGTGGVTMCRQGFRFTTSTDGGGNNLSTISTSNRSLRIELGTATLNPYISKPWNEGSDIRRKDIIANVSASIESIADAPIFNFRYKGDLAECVNLGTSAQYWRNVFPCGVTEMGDGYLAMSYGSIALAAAVVTARKVQNHEDRIRELEERLSLSEAENKALREEIELLKAA